MKNLFIIIFIMGAIGCSNSSLEQKPQNQGSIKSIEDTTSTIQPLDPVQEKEIIRDNKADLTDEELIRKWSWNDKISQPINSSISNSKFEDELLLKTWTWIDSREAVFTFSLDSLKIQDEKNYIYSLNYDSLRIFTSYDHPGDGFTRGIITKLTKDSLVIEWSTNDMNKYVPIKSK